MRTLLFGLASICLMVPSLMWAGDTEFKSYEDLTAYINDYRNAFPDAQRPPDPSEWKEVQWSAFLSAYLEQTRHESYAAEYRLPDASRIDIRGAGVAWEVEWVDKWTQGIGQSLQYHYACDDSPGLIVLLRGDSVARNFNRITTVVTGLRAQGYDYHLMFVEVN